MDFDIKDIIDDELDNVNVTLDQYYDDKVKERIDNLIEEQNKNVEENANYKQELLGILDRLKDMNIDVNYSSDMSIYELENIVSKFNI